MSTTGLVTDAAFLTALDAYTTQIEGISHVISVRNLVRMSPGTSVSQYVTAYNSPPNTLTNSVLEPFFVSDLNHVARTTILLDIQKNDDPIGTIIRKVRSLTADPAISQYLSVHGVSGTAALDYDVLQDVSATFGNLVAVIFCAMFVLLFLLTGSIFLPFKAIVTATLSLVASFGFIILIFQEGPKNAEDLMQFKADGTIDPLQLLFIFAVSFGLSLDYEVFMLTRIQEIYERTKDQEHAVCAGIELSAKVVTYAAVLLCIVLGAFLNSKIILLKYIGAVR
jgi:RND superfamily putative drug exporter